MNKYYEELKSLCKRYGLYIEDSTIYTQRLFGKSGDYAPIYEPFLLRDSKTWSERVLRELRDSIDKIIKKGRNVRLSLVMDDDIDLRSSIINLTECYGRRTIVIKVDEN